MENVENKKMEDFKVAKTLKGESYEEEMISLHHAIMDIYTSFRYEIAWKTDEWNQCYDRRSQLLDSEDKGITLIQEVMLLRKVLKTMLFIVKVNAYDLKLEQLIEDLN